MAETRGFTGILVINGHPLFLTSRICSGVSALYASANAVGPPGNAIIRETLGEYEVRFARIPSGDARPRAPETANIQLSSGDGVAKAGRGRSTPKPAAKKRGRPQTIPDENKVAALRVKDDKGSNRDAAKKIYGEQYPTPQQVKNVPSILRSYKKKVEKSLCQSPEAPKSFRKTNKDRG
jgi:hypothetical protein